MTNKKVSIIIISALSAILLCVLVLFVIIPMADFSNSQENMLSISADSGYYDKSLRVKIDLKSKLMPGAKIYYTIDGTDPDPKTRIMRENDTDIEIESTCKEYDGSSIRLQQLQGKTSVYVVKVKVKYLWMSSKVESRTYIVGESIDKAFGMNVISITSDFESLYDYNNGILVPGKTYDDNYEEDKEGFIKGNYSNRDGTWVKRCEITMFDTDNNVVINQKAGLSVSGGTSAAFDVKSLKINADEFFDINNPKLDISLYDEEFSYLSQFSLTSGIRLRSGSQDLTQGANIRSCVIDELAKQSNFDGRSGSQRAVVLINGEFYGIFDMQYNYSNSYLKNRYGLPDNVNIEKHKQDILHDNKESDDFFEKYYNYFNADLTVEENRKQLEKFIDMDDYLLYYAINILSNNTDWPYNNFEIWRYTGGYDGVNKYTDGKFRCLIYDVDMTYMTEKNHQFIGGQADDNFVSLMEKRFAANNSPLSNVMKYKGYRDKLVTVICDLLNTSFDADNVNKIIDEEYAKISNAVLRYLGKEQNDKNLKYVKLMHEAVNKKESDIRKDFNDYFGLNESYDMNLVVSNGLTVSWNNMKLYGETSVYSDLITTYHNKYYKGVNFTISADASLAYNFKGFLVNGKLYNENELTITDDMIENGELNIEAQSEMVMGDCLIIKEVHYDEEGTWLKVKNIGFNDISLNKYYITDNDKRLKAYNLPDITLNPEQIYVIEGRNLDKDNKCEFKFECGKTFYLTDGEKVLDTIIIPRMGMNENYLKYLDSNTYVYTENTPSRKDETK